MTENPQNPQSPQDPQDPGGRPAQDVPPPGQQPGYGVPQQPGYGAPQQPGYGAQQQPGYGAPQQPGYGAQQQPGYGAQQYSAAQPPAYGGPAGPQATDSLARGWDLFKANPWPFVLAQLAWAGIFLVPTLIMVLFLAAAGAFASPSFNPDTGEYEGGEGLIAALGFIGLVIMVLVYIALAVLQMGAFASATLKAVDGGRVSFGDFFRVRNFGQLLILALLLGVASAILAITVIGVLIVLFFGIWSILFVVDRRQSAIEAISSSFRFASQNAGQSVVLILLSYLLNFLGGLLCGIGTLITNPLTLLGFADFYRRVAGPAQQRTYGPPAVG